MSYFTRTANPLLTILLPSRNRFDLCKNTIDSFVDTCSQKSNLEIIVKFDIDDHSSLSRIHELRKDVNIKVLVSDRLRGYFSLHEFCNQMLKQSTGDWILLVNDDSLMTTDGWDKLLEQVSPATHRSILNNTFEGTSDVALLNLNLMDAPTRTFPVVRRSVCQKLGYFTLHPITDEFLNRVYHGLNATLNVPEIQMRHLNNEVWDETRRETADAQLTVGNDFSDQQCENTAFTIKTYMECLKNGGG